VEERLGGEAGFREMIRSGNDLGFHMQVHDNFIMTCAASPRTASPTIGRSISMS
jgi:hypothetical protein